MPTHCAFFLFLILPTACATTPQAVRSVDPRAVSRAATGKMRHLGAEVLYQGLVLLLEDKWDASYCPPPPASIITPCARLSSSFTLRAIALGRLATETGTPFPMERVTGVYFTSRQRTATALLRGQAGQFVLDRLQVADISDNALIQMRLGRMVRVWVAPGLWARIKALDGS